MKKIDENVLLELKEYIKKRAEPKTAIPVFKERLTERQKVNRERRKLYAHVVKT